MNLLLGLFQIGYTAGYLLISPVMEKVNRKHLFVTASGLMALALSILASNCRGIDSLASTETEPEMELEAEPEPNYGQIVLPVAVLMFSLCYGAGFGPAIYTWSSELFPPRY